ncbi:sugar-binding transcriptional regulator [Atrimonas thermophila]|uniref:sugar-binding transcriptional regulator n=1 Tax=Atrimonas thermophila TaxID=3064161 RepID=UPI00399C9633
MYDPQIGIISVLYFEKGLSQQEIAIRLGVSKMTVSRVLQRAKDLGVVKIQISKPFELHEELEKAIQAKFGTKKVYVVNPHRSEEDATALLGNFFAFQINTNLLNNTILGIGVGKTIAKIADCLLPMKTKNIEIVQLLGGLTNVVKENPFSIVQEFCRKLGAKGTYVASPAAVEDSAWRDQILYQTSNGVTLLEKWKECEQALFGIGVLDGGTLLSPSLVTDEEMREIREKGGIGDILGHVFDANGRFLQTNLEKRLVSIPIDTLLKIPERIAIGGGVLKAKAIKGLLRTGIVTTLVTDAKCAQYVIK